MNALDTAPTPIPASEHLAALTRLLRDVGEPLLEDLRADGAADGIYRDTGGRLHLDVGRLARSGVAPDLVERARWLQLACDEIEAAARALPARRAERARLLACAEVIVTAADVPGDVVLRVLAATSRADERARERRLDWSADTARAVLARGIACARTYGLPVRLQDHGGIVAANSYGYRWATSWIVIEISAEGVVTSISAARGQTTAQSDHVGGVRVGRAEVSDDVRAALVRSAMRTARK